MCGSAEGADRDALRAENTALRQDLADAEHTLAQLGAELREIITWVRKSRTDGELRTLFYQRWGVAHVTPRPAPLWLETQRAAEAAGEGEKDRPGW